MSLYFNGDMCDIDFVTSLDDHADELHQEFHIMNAKCFENRKKAIVVNMQTCTDLRISRLQ